MQGFLILIMISAIIMITYALSAKSRIGGPENTENISHLEAKLNELDFNASQKIIPLHNHTIVAINETSQQIAILTRYPTVNEEVFVSIINFKDVLSTEVLENGTQITSVSTSSQIGRALIGTALAGGVGAIIGGLSGKSTSKTEISQLGVRITVNDLKEPIHEISFLPGILPAPRDNPLMPLAMNQLNNLHAIMSIIIKRNDDRENEVKNRIEVSN